MRGKSTFTTAEVDELRELIREKQTADRTHQKALRARMRRLGFFIRDFTSYGGFTISDLDDLLARGSITIESDAAAEEPFYIDGGDNADWTKQTLDYFVPDGVGGMRRVRNSDDMRDYLRMSSMTIGEFKRLPAYRLALRRQPWLREL